MAEERRREREGSFRPYTSSWGEKAEREGESAGGRKVLGEEREGKGRFGFVRKEGREVSAAFFSGKGHRRRLPPLLHIASE